MTFDVKNSKLYSQIMTGLAAFFELDETATETDIHAKIEGSEPLSKMLEAAATKAVGDLKDQLSTLTEKVTDLEGKVSNLTERAENAEAQIAAKDDRIEELQTEIGEKSNAIDALKAQHKTETDRLSGKIASLRAGAEKETDQPDEHAATKVGKGSDGVQVHVIQSKNLKNLVTRQPLN